MIWYMRNQNKLYLETHLDPQAVVPDVIQMNSFEVAQSYVLKPNTVPRESSTQTCSQNIYFIYF